jgi:hypothetical protein
MKNVAFYHRATGILHRFTLVTSDDNAVALNTPADHVAINQPAAGALDPLCQRVDITTKEIVSYQPPAPSTDHEWNGRRWHLSDSALKRKAALRQISALEVSQHRPLREAALGVPGARERLESIEAQIAALRKDLI